MGLTLVRCGCLRGISPVGFVDFKEQALPAIAASHRVRVVHRPGLTGLSVRTAAGYLAAVRHEHLAIKGDAPTGHPFEEDHASAFGLAEAGANVHPSAWLHGSVVLRGGQVGRGVVLVRSVVCPGGHVHEGQVVCDQVVAPPHRHRREGWSPTP